MAVEWVVGVSLHETPNRRQKRPVLSVYRPISVNERSKGTVNVPSDLNALNVLNVPNVPNEASEATEAKEAKETKETNARSPHAPTHVIKTPTKIAASIGSNATTAAVVM